ncbi:hypothetical protein ES703_01285 [subsurface metagenome]
MHVDVIIPTWNRIDLLRNAVDSITASSYKDVSVFIIVDGNKKVFETVSTWPNKNVCIFFNEKNIDWIRSINKGLRHATDAAIYAGDDITFDQDCIEKAVALLKQKSPAGDALIGLRQKKMGSPTCFGLIGRKFITHFPGNQVFCPDYIHYGGDSEIARYVKKVGKFYHSPTVGVTHHRGPTDETYRLTIAKKTGTKDNYYFKKRRALGLTWGISFRLINEGREGNA